tara:strand:+ start:1567 stop:1860 length:294 start_codon:yes stop_codon:yes gene_type:complete
MDILDEVTGRYNIIEVTTQLQNSIDDMVANNPNRTDYIEPMKVAKTKLVQSLVIFDELRSEVKLFKNHCGTLQMNIQMRDAKILELEKKVNEIMELL